MTQSGYRTIVIEARHPYGVMRGEEIGLEAITPGHLLEISSGHVQKQSSSGGSIGVPRIALESPHVDEPGSDSIDVDYAGSDTVYFAYGATGEAYYMWLAASQNVSKGDMLMGDGNGDLTALSGTTLRSAVAEAGEDKDLSSSTRGRIKARIL